MLSILSRISDVVSPTFFLQNVFLVMLSSPGSRMAALNYLSRRLTAPPSTSERTDLGLMIRGVAAVLEDDNSLVRRSGLDLLLRVLPLDGELLKDAETKDKQLLIRAATSIVLQREISLSRRVYTWLLGKDETQAGQVEYFKANGLELLADTLREDMQSGSPEQTQPAFKVFLSLLDKWEIGETLSQRLAIPALNALQRQDSSKSDTDEGALATASAVYESIEPITIWSALFALLKDQGETGLMRWLLSTLPQKDEEVTEVYVPVVLDHVLAGLEVGRILHIEH